MIWVDADRNQIYGKICRNGSDGHRSSLQLYGMGRGAVDIFNEKGIEVITGASSDAETAANNYLQGKLKLTGSVCHQHSHE